MSASIRCLTLPISSSNYGFALLAENAISLPHPACIAQAGFWEVEVLRAGEGVNARYVTYEAVALPCFRCWEVRSFGDWEKTSKKTPKLQASQSPSSESKEVLCNCSSVLFRQTARRDASPHPAATTERGLNYSIWWITATAMCAQMSRT